MESRHSLLRTHSDQEPTPNPSQEGNGQDADERLLPSWEGPGVGRFMERWRAIGNVSPSLQTSNTPWLKRGKFKFREFIRRWKRPRGSRV